MGFKHHWIAHRARRLTPSERLVLWHIADTVSDKLNDFTQSNATIAAILELSERAASRAVTKLAVKGLVKVTPRSTQSGRTSNRVELLIPSIAKKSSCAEGQNTGPQLAKKSYDLNPDLNPIAAVVESLARPYDVQRLFAAGGVDRKNDKAMAPVLASWIERFENAARSGLFADGVRVLIAIIAEVLAKKIKRGGRPPLSMRYYESAINQFLEDGNSARSF